MSELYGDSHRALQDQFDTRKLADGLERNILRKVLAPMDRKFIASVDMFFLSTVDQNGWPSVSYKGGFKGFVKIVDDRTLAFPAYDGNGMFYSLGNIVDQSKVGLLFIDFEQPRRLRVHGTASIDADDPLLSEYHEAALVVRVDIHNIFTNCARYIHKFRREETSKYVPEKGTETPPPDWKRVDKFQELLPERDRGVADRSGGLLSEEEYRKDFWKGLD